MKGCRALCGSLEAGRRPERVLRETEVRARFRGLLREFAHTSTGSSNRVTRERLLEEPPSLDAGEITDKGSINQCRVLDRRAALVESLYSAESGPRILRLEMEER